MANGALVRGALAGGAGAAGPGQISNRAGAAGVRGASIAVDPWGGWPEATLPPLPDPNALSPQFQIDVSAIQRVAGLPEAVGLSIATTLVAMASWRRRLWLATLMLRGFGLLRLW
jgi:hypothetical protein